METLINKITVITGTVNELTDLPDHATPIELSKYFKESFLDSEFYYDVNLESLLESLEYNGFSYKQILQYNKHLYGNFIDFYYYTDLNMYAMEIGVR